MCKKILFVFSQSLDITQS